MPKTPIDKDRNFRRSEQDIYSSVQSHEGLYIGLEAKTSPMEC